MSEETLIKSRPFKIINALTYILIINIALGFSSSNAQGLPMHEQTPSSIEETDSQDRICDELAWQKREELIGKYDARGLAERLKAAEIYVNTHFDDIANELGQIRKNELDHYYTSLREIVSILGFEVTDLTNHEVAAVWEALDKEELELRVRNDSALFARLEEADRRNTSISDSFLQRQLDLLRRIFQVDPAHSPNLPESIATRFDHTPTNSFKTPIYGKVRVVVDHDEVNNAITVANIYTHSFAGSSGDPYYAFYELGDDAGVSWTEYPIKEIWVEKIFIKDKLDEERFIFEDNFVRSDDREVDDSLEIHHRPRSSRYFPVSSLDYRDWLVGGVPVENFEELPDYWMINFIGSYWKTSEDDSHDPFLVNRKVLSAALHRILETDETIINDTISASKYFSASACSGQEGFIKDFSFNDPFFIADGSQPNNSNTL